jgi:ElaA protein
MEDIAACLQIRLTVFVAEQAVPLIEEVDDWDSVATHYLACLADVPCGTARLVRLSDDEAKIGRVAVLKSRRGLGLGSALMEHILSNEGAAFRRLRLDSQLTALSFYEKFGFRAAGGVFMDAGIPHRTMYRQRDAGVSDRSG